MKKAPRPSRRAFWKQVFLGLELVLDDLGDGAHRAFLDAIAAGDAGFLVHDLDGAADDLEDFFDDVYDLLDQPDSRFSVVYDS